MRWILPLTLSLFFVACSSKPVVPESKSVKVSREDADKDCKELGQVMGRLITVKGTAEQALEDLKQEAANKGANYVVVKQYSANQTSVTGLAYDCP